MTTIVCVNMSTFQTDANINQLCKCRQKCVCGCTVININNTSNFSAGIALRTPVYSVHLENCISKHKLNERCGVALAASI